MFLPISPFLKRSSYRATLKISLRYGRFFLFPWLSGSAKNPDNASVVTSSSFFTSKHDFWTSGCCL